MCVCVSTHASVYAHMWRVTSLVTFPYCSSPYIFEIGSVTEWGLSSSAPLTCWSPPVSVSLVLWQQAFYHTGVLCTLGTQSSSQVLIFGWQAWYWMSYLSTSMAFSFWWPYYTKCLYHLSIIQAEQIKRKKSSVLSSRPQWTQGQLWVSKGMSKAAGKTWLRKCRATFCH